MAQVTFENFLSRSFNTHGALYGYDRVDYKNTEIKVSITCKLHGDFAQAPRHHMDGRGCPKCAKDKLFNKRRRPLEDFIAVSNALYGDIYDYSKTDYLNNYTKVIIGCPHHGDFTQTPAVHLRGNGCAKCSKIIAGKDRRKTIDQFIAKANEVHGDRYNYSQSDYQTNNISIIIICETHGPFEQTPVCHLSGNGCPFCSYDLKRYTTEEFILVARTIHLDEYDYSQTVYVSSAERVVVGCRKHGDFEVFPSKHIRGQGCPMCSESKGEKAVRRHLNALGLPFERQKTFETCKRLRKLPFDFYVHSPTPLLIEFQGRQHYHKNVAWHKTDYAWNQIQESDQIKFNWAKGNNIELLRIPYWEMKNVASVIDEFIKSCERTK